MQESDSPSVAQIPENVKIMNSIFSPYVLEKGMRAIFERQRFVHYTSADTALKIISNRQVWMRQSHA